MQAQGKPRKIAALQHNERNKARHQLAGLPPFPDQPGNQNERCDYKGWRLEKQTQKQTTESSDVKRP